MKPLFGREGRKALKALGAKKSLYAFDFDGTLAAIVPVPAKARMHSASRRRLLELSRSAPVAVLSGRSRADLKIKLNMKGVLLVGNHGLETGSCPRTKLAAAKRTTRRWLRRLETEDLGPGVWVEDKLYSLSVHYLASPAKGQAKRRLAKVFSKLKPQARIVGGKSVFNLIPPNSPHKGDALLNLMKTLKVQAAFYLGDDDTDEDVFRLARANKTVLTVRVGRKKGSRAEYFINSQKDLNRALDLLRGRTGTTI
jgi:trehalose 6-phosphate phosphatase